MLCLHHSVIGHCSSSSETAESNSTNFFALNVGIHHMVKKTSQCESDSAITSCHSFYTEITKVLH